MEFIPHILYINLDSRPDRLAQITSELSCMGLSGERLSAVNTVPHGYIGCSATHIKGLKLARECGWENVVMLEDDFQFVVNKETLERQLREFFSRGIEYDVLFLGYNLINSGPKDNLVGKALEVQTTSGYIVHKRFYDILIKHLEEGLEKLTATHNPSKYTIDQWWKSLQPVHSWYYFVNRIGIQRPGYSDIEGRVVNYRV